MNWIIRNVVISSLLAFGVFSFIFFSETGEWPEIRNQWEGFLLAIFLANIGGIAQYYFNLHFNKTVPWNLRRGLRFGIEILSGFIIFSALAFLFYLIYISPGLLLGQESGFWQKYWDGLVKFSIILVVLLYISSLVNFSMFSYNQYNVAQIESLSVEREQLHLQFEALKSQLNPHFLFNSLNTISSLTYRDVSSAEDYIRKLANSYNYILQTNDRHLVTLDEEMKMVHSFFYMQLIKYEGCMSMDVEIPEKCMDSLVPPLCIQMLIENALKHNLICKEKELKIEISCKGETITVRNNIIQKPVLLRVGNDVFDRPKENGSHKIGLENIKRRYRYFINKEVEIIRNDHFTVKLPLISQEIERKTIL